VHPNLVTIGSFAIHSYGLLLAVAFLVAIQIFLARGRARGLSEDRLSTLSLWILILAIVGGRALFVLTHWEEYKSDPMGVVRLWEGGLMLYGGYILAIAGGIAYVRRAGLPVWRVADAAAPSMAIGVGIGRLGCFLNGCCYGLPTHLPWGIHFPPESYSSTVFPNAALHPAQLYMSLAGFGLFFVLLALDRKPRFDGHLFWTYIALDAALRFLIDFTRYYDETSFLGKIGGLSFNVNQLLSAGLMLVSITMLYLLRGRASSAPLSATGSTDEAGRPDAHGLESQPNVPPRAKLPDAMPSPNEAAGQNPGA
jgi:phosphatidylglycerol:prolipoprotein diacylglycerol transferase